ncbi:MAG: CotH kinase family protein [Chitinophagales bacterium]
MTTFIQRKWIVCFLLLCFASSASVAQVVINEFSAANYDDITDNYGENEDWIELYNIDSNPLDLTDYFLSDKIDNPTKWAFPAGTIIQGNGFLRIWASGRDEGNGNNMHTNFKLKQTKNNEAVVFSSGTTILDSYEILEANKTNQSRGRMTDGDPIWGVLTEPTPNAANVNVRKGYTPKPIFNLEAGYYPNSIDLTLSSADATANIYYTTNGDEPDNNSTLYVGNVTLPNTRVIRAIAYSDDLDVLPSFVESNTYFIGADEHTLPVIAVSGEGVEDLLNDNLPWWNEDDPIGAFEYFDNTQQLIDEGVGEFNKHGNDSWFYDQRGFDYIMQDEFGYNHALQDEMFPNTDRDKFQRVMLKAAANDNYSFENGAHVRDLYVHKLSQNADLELDERSGKFCIVYLNGNYWGVYDIREKVDDNDFTSYYYDQGREWIDYIKTWGNTWAEYGSIDDWNDLHEYIVDNDMTVQSNYDYVASELNVNSLIDYMIINTHVVCMDWLNYNTAWWRGRKGDGVKWRYTLWDMDASFGHYINYTGVPDTGPEADPCNTDELYEDFTGDPEGHTEMLSSLLENEDFYAQYINRYADLNNTFFTCDYMIGMLDDMVAEIAPEMPRQIDRWGGSMNGWQTAVNTLENFINSRCVAISEGIVDCYEVEGPYPLTVIVEPAGAGTVLVNSVEISNFPWSGDYFGGLDLSFEALANESFTFSYWENTNASNLISPSLSTAEIDMEFVAGDTLIVHFNSDDIYHQVVIEVEPPLAGDVNFNAFVNMTYPWDISLIEGSPIAIEAIANAGFAFDFWELNENTILPDVSSAVANFDLLAADTLTAHFIATVPTYEVTFVVEPPLSGDISLDGTILTANPFTATFAENAEISLEALAAEGFTFANWTSENNDINADEATTTVIITADDVITLIFNEIPDVATITFVIDENSGGTILLDNGTIINDTFSAEWESGTLINLEALAEEGYTFGYWNTSNNTPIEPDANSNNINFTVGANDSISVFFEPISYEITVTLPDNTQGNISINGETVNTSTYTFTVNYGEEINLNALPIGGNVFGNWTIDGLDIISGDLNSTGLVLAAAADGTISLSFRANCLPAIPSAFSPNEDGVNDEFKMHILCPINDYQAQIYDRWGNLIFESTDVSLTWNGKYKGKICDIGVYPYLISYEITENGETKTETHKGHITLIR